MQFKHILGDVLTRSATLHKPSESWSKDSTVSTPGGPEQAFPSKRSVFFRAALVAAWKPSGQLSSGTPNKPWNQRSHTHTHTRERHNILITPKHLFIEAAGISVAVL